MAFPQVPQRFALEELERMLAVNQNDQEILLLAVMGVRRRRREREGRQRRPRRWWVKPWISRRQLHGQFYNIFEELDQECVDDYRSYLRLDRNLFAEVLQRIEPRITKDPRLVEDFLKSKPFFREPIVHSMSYI